MFWAGLLIGVIVGACVGMALMAWLVAGSRREGCNVPFDLMDDPPDDRDVEYFRKVHDLPPPPAPPRPVPPSQSEPWGG
jgi:hypothetical protein